LASMTKRWLEDISFAVMSLYHGASGAYQSLAPLANLYEEPDFFLALRVLGCFNLAFCYMNVRAIKSSADVRKLVRQGTGFVWATNILVLKLAGMLNTWTYTLTFLVPTALYIGVAYAD